MATPNADNAAYNPGSAADQDARVRRDERIRLVAERDRTWRDLQQLRTAVAQEVRTFQALGGRNEATAISTARRQAEVVALERLLQQLEQALAATGPDTEVLTQLDEGPEAGIGPSLAREEASQQRDTTDIRRRTPARQLAGSAGGASGRVLPFRGAGTATPAQALQQTVGSAESGNAVTVQSKALDAGFKDVASQLRSRLNQRAAQNRTQKDADRHSIKKLQAARYPNSAAWLAVAVAAVCIDALDIALTAADVAFGIGTVISIILNTAMFLCMRSIMNRGTIISWALALCILFGVLLNLMPMPFSFIALPFFGVVGIAGVFNGNAAPVDSSKEAMEKNIKRMEKSVKVARQTTAKAIRFARRAGKYSKRVAKFTKRIVRSKTFRTIAKRSKTVGKLLARLGGPIANSLPLIRLFPFQLLTVWLTYRGLKRDYAEAQELLAQYAATAREETQAILESEIIRAEVLGAETEEAVLTEEPTQQPQIPQQPAPRAAVRTTPVTDIARPGSGVPSTVRPVQQRPGPRAMLPMRDVAVAA